MAFLRISKGKSRNYVVIVRGFRDAKGIPRQKTIKNLGSFKTEEEKEKLLTLGNRLIAELDGQKLVSPSQMQEKARQNWGAASVISQLFSIFKLDSFFDNALEKRKIEYDLQNILKYLIASHFVEPSSKLKSFNKQGDFDGFDEFSLYNLYKSLDELHLYNHDIQSHIFKMQQKFSKNKIDVVLFDVTTLYFESQKDDELKNFGYSKDCKFNEVQIVLCLMINSDGRPIGYEIFPGNQFEGHTLIPCLLRLREKYSIEEVIIVADRGINSFNNLKTLRDNNFHYIVASKIGAHGHALRELILDNTDYKKLSENSEEILKYKVIRKIKNGKDTEGKKSQIQDNMLCLYSSKRAKKDAKDRQRLVMKAHEMLASGVSKDKRGAAKYLIKEDSLIQGIDLEKIHNDSLVDGYYALSYSKEHMSVEEVMSSYHSLWKIEESFRTMKSFFEMRPIFVWTPKRISGHIMLNFISLVFERHIEILLSEKGQKMSQNDIRDAISDMQKSTILVDDKTISLHSNLNEKQKILLDLLKITPPKNC